MSLQTNPVLIQDVIPQVKNNNTRSLPVVVAAGRRSCSLLFHPRVVPLVAVKKRDSNILLHKKNIVIQ